MFFIDELKDLKLYKRQFLLPVNEKSKKKNSAVILMGTNYESSKGIMNYPLLVNRYFNSYYTEKSVTFYTVSENGHMKYIRDESSLVSLEESSIDDIIKSNKITIHYNGYDYDTDEVMAILNPDLILYMNKDFGIKLPNDIYVNVYRKSVVPPNTKDTINISSKKFYNSDLKNYNSYVKYNTMEMILNNNKEILDKSLLYAVCIYESDLYFIHKKHWIFGDNLKGICYAIELYVDSKGHKRFAKDIVVNNGSINKLTKSTIKKAAKTEVDKLVKLFGLDESLEISRDDLTKKYHMVNNILSVNETTGITLPLLEDSSYNQSLKRLLYNDRYKSIKEVKAIYEKVKEENPQIKYTYLDYNMYKSLNLFVDVSHYNESYIKNSKFKMDRGYNTYFELMTRLINDNRLEPNGYNKKTVIIPIHDWDFDINYPLWLYTKTINPISCLYNTMLKNTPKLKELFGDTLFIFIAKNGYFKLSFSDFDAKTGPARFVKCIKHLRENQIVQDDDIQVKDSPKAITMNVIDKVEKSQGIEIDDISIEDNNEKEKPITFDKTDKEKNNDDKKELVKAVNKIASTSADEDEAIDNMDNDKIKNIIASLSEDPDEKSNISAARASRVVKIENDLMNKQFKGRPIRDILNDNPVEEQKIPESSIKIQSVNDEWNHMTYMNINKVYDMDKDIIGIFNSFSKMNPPLYVIDISVEDTSTNQDAIETYSVKYEDGEGKRFTIKIDVPKMIDNNYMLLRGNRKDIPSQLFLMPIIKTDDDTVQIVTNYNKIFIRRFGTTSGKSNVSCDKLMKVLRKHEFKSLKIYEGDNSNICKQYELPIDYIDLASSFSKLETPSTTIYFNQEELREKCKNKIDLSKGLPFGIQDDKILYFNSLVGDNISQTFASYLAIVLSSDRDLAKEQFSEKYESMPKSVRYTYSKASILNTEIPLIVICGYSEGLIKTLNKANIKYKLEEKKPRHIGDYQDYIRFQDGYLIYELDYASSLLMNGLKACPTESYSLGDMNDRAMYMDFLDIFGGRIKADGLDNFYNMLIDKPITYDTLKYYQLPTDYIEILLYANRLLADNKYVKHTQITNNRRIRRNEQIPAMLYSVMGRAYAQYCTSMKHGRKVPMSVKQSALISEVLENSTTSDMSIINALNEYEGHNAVTPKGPSGMNSDRSYTLDKRSYDDSMFNIMGLSTGFAGTVGITRQMTIDANISTQRGYIINKEENPDTLSATKSLCMTEALTPFGTDHDDPFRSAMTFIQTNKHGMRCARSNPGLITNGADEALPYMISNIFAHKSSKDGTVVDINDERMIVEYKDGTSEYIDLTEHVEKNSSSGFFVTLKLDTDLKPGKKFKAGDILAYDKSSFSSDIGEDNNIAYNIGTIGKIAILNTDEGYEDSAIISKDLSDALTSDVVLCKQITLNKNTNVYNMVKKGQSIQEGDTLMIIQTPYDDEDANILLRNLATDEEEVTNLGRIPIKSKVTGVIQDIVITRCVDTDELSPSLKKIVNDYEKDIKRRRKEMEQYNSDTTSLMSLGSTDKLPATGKLKACSDGLLIEIYMKYEDRMSVGDKLIYMSALKGTVKDIFPEGDEPRSKYRPNEKIHSMLAIGSVNGRMVCSVLITAGIYKAMVELSRKTKDILGIPYNDNLFED